MKKNLKARNDNLLTLGSILLALLIFVMLLNSKRIAAEELRFSPYVDKSGNISLPKDFRNSMTHLGSWFVPEGDASGFHDVYTEPDSVRTYRDTGKFPDGATLIKELRASNSGDYTTGKNVSYATSTIKQWFVMIKDTKGRFENNPNWGDGWGWALIKTNNIKENVTTNYRTDCLVCHIPAKKTNWIYIEGYPTLSRSKQ
ncbi:MAG: cytochrome P460 family protein [Methylococcaceae bacterium]